MLVVHIKYNF
jgi:hypothetical protein